MLTPNNPSSFQNPLYAIGKNGKVGRKELEKSALAQLKDQKFNEFHSKEELQFHNSISGHKDDGTKAFNVHAPQQANNESTQQRGGGGPLIGPLSPLAGPGSRVA